MRINEDNYLEQLKNRNEKALEYVIETYGWIIKTVVNKHLSVEYDHREECYNDILLSVWNNIESYKPEKNTFKNWVAAISKYKAIDYQRKYIKELQQEQWENHETTVIDQRIHHLEEEANDEIKQMLSSLSSKDQALFVEIYAKETPVNEVSKKSGLSKAVIYNRLSRGKKKLRKSAEQ